jgi:hypothetical protein
MKKGRGAIQSISVAGMATGMPYHCRKPFKGGHVKKIMMLLMLMSVTAFAAAATQEKQADAKPSPAMPMMMMDNACPMNSQDFKVTAADTPNGIALNFTTKPEKAAELRRRVEQMATMHGTAPVNEAMAHGQMMPATVKYEPIENGARLTLTPKDPAQLTKFRTDVRAHVERMQNGQCSMMADMMQGMMKGMMGGTAKPEEPKATPKKEDADHDSHHPEEKK